MVRTGARTLACIFITCELFELCAKQLLQMCRTRPFTKDSTFCISNSQPAGASEAVNNLYPVVFEANLRMKEKRLLVLIRLDQHAHLCLSTCNTPNPPFVLKRSHNAHTPRGGAPYALHVITHTCNRVAPSFWPLTLDCCPPLQPVFSTNATKAKLILQPDLVRIPPLLEKRKAHS
jgi:hypothetical protein